MADLTPTALLTANQQHTAQAFEQINQAITTSFNRQEQARQFDAQLIQRGTEFGVEMALKDRALQASTAMNILQAEDIRFGNEMDAARFEMEKELQPQKQEIAKLQLEAQKELTKKQIEAGRQQSFNTMTVSQDSRVASALAGTRNADLGNGYLALKSKYQGKVGAGESFNETAFSSEVDALISTYSNQPADKTEYDPELATLMDRMGATGEAARYRAENPIFAGSLPGIKANMLLADEDNFNKNIQQYGFMFKGQELPQVAAVRNSLNGYRSRINQKEQEKQGRIRSSGFYKDDVARQKNDQEIAKLDEEITTITKAHDTLFNKTVGFDIQDVTPPTEKSKEEKDYFDTLNRVKSEAEQPSKIAIAPRAQSSFTQSNEANDAEANIGTYTSQFPDALGDKTSFISWSGKNINPRKDPAYANSLRREIINNLEGIPLDSLEAKSEGGQTLDKLINAKEFKDVFDKLKNNAVKMDPPDGIGGYGMFIGDRNIWQWATTSGLDSTGFVELESHEEFMNYARQLKKQIKDPDRYRDVIQKLYASVVAAGAIDQFSKGK